MNNLDSDDNEDDVPEQQTQELERWERLPDQIKHLFEDILKFRVDPAGKFHGITSEKIQKSLKKLRTNNIIAVTDELSSTHQERGQMYDPTLTSFVQGCGGQIDHWDKVQGTNTPVVLRGITKGKIMKACWETGRDFYYIDTGYFGNEKGKLYHRITKNNVQNFGPIIDRPGDRFSQTGQRLKKFRRDGSKILLAPPSQKLLKFYQIDLETWMAETIAEIKKYTDREIVVRHKQLRKIRSTTDTIQMALADDVYCLVTYSSIAAGEALLCGKPAITLGPNVAAPLCSTNISEIESINIPSLDQVDAWARHLAYCQFTRAEMENGTAWNILNDS
jgi:hypothetical protein